ncbi:Geranylgeranyl diphosphate synthase [Geodia barretti]|uniref:Geranylgeranyl diphosphate synthase n=1 Tax=Geodia barretti TaxID=519541 RepID=A0AA35R6M1_GEOBA|nr:Geranylgeranyl diphosphate synthase [Geodia barretti]
MHSTGDLAALRAAEQGVSPKAVVRVSEILTDSYLAMIEGQCLDLEFEGRTDITTDEYLHMIACKTGALIRCGLETGALLADGDEEAVEAFAKFGEGLGRAFQVRDDYLGIWGDEATLGKATGNDIRRRKKSYPVVFALERAAGAALDDLHRIYGQTELQEDDVERVLAILDEVGAREQSQFVTEEAANRALRALTPIPLPEWAKTEAEELVDFLARREY